MVSGAGVVQYPASPSLQFGTMVTRFGERPRRNATTKWPASWIAVCQRSPAVRLNMERTYKACRLV